MNNQQKVALVTGASAGIGEATVGSLMNAGYKVYAAARRVDRMKSLETAGAALIHLDLTVDSSIVAAVDRILKAEGRIDVLINNAGYGSYGSVEDVPLDEARRQFEVNVFGLARLIQLFAPTMRQQRSGKIVNVTSIGGKIWEPLGGWYHATKFAVEGLSDCLRMELGPFGIDVIVIEPGGIKTEWASIAKDQLLKLSGRSAYREQALRTANALRQADQMSSDPAVVSDAILKAVKANRPKTRYAMGLGATPILTLRRVLSDRMMDGVMRMVINYGNRNSTAV